MQTVEVDCAPLSGQRTMEVFLMVFLFFYILYSYGRGRESLGFAWMHKIEGNRLNCGSELHFF